MTREEAIEILQGAIKKPNTKDGYLGQAIDMAIQLLSAEPCEDCISRQAVLNILMPYCTDDDGSVENTDDLRNALDEIESLPAIQPISAWIPTSERYPKDSETVLITLGKTVYKASTVSHRTCWFVHGDNNMFCASKEDVTAWMPLPEPYCGADMREVKE